MTVRDGGQRQAQGDVGIEGDQAVLGDIEVPFLSGIPALEDLLGEAGIAAILTYICSELPKRFRAGQAERTRMEATE